MATPTGQISLLDVRNELKMSGQIDMNNGNVRQLAGRPSGQIAMSDLRGKSSYITITAGRYGSQSSFWGFMRPNAVWNFSFGNATSQSLDGGGVLKAIYVAQLGGSFTQLYIASKDYGSKVTVQVDGTNYTFDKYNSAGGEFQYKSYDKNLMRFVSNAGQLGKTFTIKKV